jgi:hypothetical protein
MRSPKTPQAAKMKGHANFSDFEVLFSALSLPWCGLELQEARSST